MDSHKQVTTKTDQGSIAGLAEHAKTTTKTDQGSIAGFAVHAKTTTKTDQGNTAGVAEHDKRTTETDPVIIVVTDQELEERTFRTNVMLDELKSNYSPETHRTNEEVRKKLISIKQMFFQFSDVSTDKALRCRRSIGTHMVEAGLVPILCEIVSDYLTTGWVNEEGEDDQAAYYRLCNAFILLFNYSDSTPAIGSAAANIPGFYELMTEKLKSYYIVHMTETGLSELEVTMVRRLLGFTHNCSSASEARTRLREAGFIAVLVPYLGAKIERFKMSSILALANIINEDECGVIHTGMEAVRFLLTSLGKAVENESRRCTGWSAKELAVGVGKLSTNDSNKKMLVNEGALPLLLKLSKCGDPEDQAEAVKALWALSFDDDNKDKMIMEPGLIATLSELCKSPESEVKHSAMGVLWILRFKLKESPEHQQMGETLLRTKTTSHLGEAYESSTDPIRHVMISYQWDCQKVIISVAEALKSRGYKTWMDVDNMGGSTLDAMAEAVENSAVVLVCMSQRYKDSPNCRAEALYAHQRGVTIVPLLMEKNYKPIGWLGILLEVKLYIDFSGEYSFDSRMDKLVKELGRKGQTVGDGVIRGRPTAALPRDNFDGGPPDSIVPTAGVTVSIRPPPSQRDDVKKWDKQTTAKWLQENELDRPTLQSLTGTQLLFLRDLKGEDPRTFYKLLQRKLKLRSVEDLAKFVEALTILL